MLVNCDKPPGRIKRGWVVKPKQRYVRNIVSLMIEWRWTLCLQTSAMPEDRGSDEIPPYIKTMMKLESMSYAMQQVTETNSKLADNLGMLVEEFARMEEREIII
jgi:hypothetical protein